MTGQNCDMSELENRCLQCSQYLGREGREGVRGGGVWGGWRGEDRAKRECLKITQHELLSPPEAGDETDLVDHNLVGLQQVL